MINTKNLTVTEIKSTESDKLPERYIAFPDNLKNAIIRMGQLEEKLHNRNLKVTVPVNAFRITYLSGTTKKYSLLVFQIDRK